MRYISKESRQLFMAKKIFMIAGPHGSGKSTTAFSFMADLMIDEYINPDNIALGLAPMHPETVSAIASKLMLRRFRELVRENKSFAFETTAAGINYVKHLKEALEEGYEFQLIFLWLSSPDLAIQRVACRIEQGNGQSVDEKTIRKRYYGGLANLIKHYLPLASKAVILNASQAGASKIIALKYAEAELHIEEPSAWEEIQKITNG